HAARRARIERQHVQGIPALHRQPPLPADRRRPALRQGRQPVPMDGGDDRLEEGEELFRNTGHRVSNRWRTLMGLTEGALSWERRILSCTRCKSTQEVRATPALFLSSVKHLVSDK